MNRKLFVIMAVLLLCSNIAFAKDKKKEKAKQSTPPAAAQEAQTQLQGMTAAQQEKEILIGNINNMRNQELRVAILQQLLNEEIAKLRNVQAVFCDQYKLDVEKLRRGEYRYDEQQGKFVETK